MEWKPELLQMYSNINYSLSQNSVLTKKTIGMELDWGGGGGGGGEGGVDNCSVIVICPI